MRGEGAYGETGTDGVTNGGTDSNTGSGGSHLGKHAGLLGGGVSHGRGLCGRGGHLLGRSLADRGWGRGSLADGHGGSLASLLGRGSAGTLTSHFFCKCRG